MASVLALLCAFTFGIADFLGGRATSRAQVVPVILLVNLTGLALTAAAVAVYGGSWSVASLGWGVAAGLAGLVGLTLLYRGLAVGPNRVVSPLSAVVGAAIPVIVGLGLGERPGLLAIVGLGLTPIAIWLVAGGDLSASASDMVPVLYGLGAGLGFGFFFAFLAQAPADDATPLVAARLAAVIVLVVLTVVMRPDRPEPGPAMIAVAAGVLDITANALFLASTRTGDLAVVGALASLFPVTTVVLAVIVLGERLNRSQLVGVGVAVVAAALLA